MIGAQAPDWGNLMRINGESVAMAEFVNRPILLLFFNIGCAGCTGRAVPLSKTFADTYPDLQLIGIHTNFESWNHSDARIQTVVDYLDFPYPVLQDNGHELYDAYAAEGTPHWILIDKEGVVRKSIFGSMDGARQRLHYTLAEMFQSADK